MRWSRLFRAQLRQALQSPWSFFFIILAVIISLAAGLTPRGTDADRFLIGMINEDEGSYGDQLLDYLQSYPQLDLRPMGKAEALALLRQDRIEAVFVIRADYTARLRRNEYRNLIDWYTAPSSRAAATISEPLINGTMRFWIEEEAIASTRQYLLDRGLAYPAVDEAAQRVIVRQVWQNQTLVNIRSVTLSDGAEGKGVEGAGERADGADGQVAACVRWYAVFCVFYLVVSASWVLDINRRGLRVRVSQSGARLWQILLGTGLAPLLLGMAGYWLTGIIACIVAGGGWLQMLALSVPMLLYLSTILGMTITLASYLRQTLALLFLAPLVTFINAILGGLIADLPSWATILALISRVLPGRWLMLSIERPWASLPAALLCCLGWMAAGILIAEFRRIKILRGG